MASDIIERWKSSAW